METATMTRDPARIVTLTDCKAEFEAESLVLALRRHGVQATTIGGHMGGWWSEQTMPVQIVVRESDLADAQRILEAIRLGLVAAEEDDPRIVPDHDDDQ